MELVLIAVTLALGCAAAAWSYPLRVARVADRCRDELAEALADARNDQERVIAANDAVNDAEHRLVDGERVPFVTAWVAALSAIAWSAAGVITGEAVRVLLQCAVPAIAAAILCVGARRHARRLLARERVRVDEAVKELVGELYDAEIVLPERRARRRSRRRRGAQ